jgi:GTP cyclohydrolase I
MKQRELLVKLGRSYPKSLACSFDFPGYQTGNKHPEKEVHKVLLCLDFTEEVLPIAISFQPDIILTHHPFFFGRKKDVLENDLLKKKLDTEINYHLDCPIYSYHTNFDIAKDGMNDVLISFLGWEILSIGSDGLLRIAKLPKEMYVPEVADILLSKFGFEYVGYLDNHRLVKRIGFIAGGAGNDFQSALKANVDLYISGDCSHHARVDMKRYGLSYIELPHECEEKGFLLGMGKKLLSFDERLEILDCRFEKYFQLRTKQHE